MKWPETLRFHGALDIPGPEQDIETHALVLRNHRDWAYVARNLSSTTALAPSSCFTNIPTFILMPQTTLCIRKARLRLALGSPGGVACANWSVHLTAGAPSKMGIVYSCYIFIPLPPPLTCRCPRSPLLAPAAHAPLHASLQAIALTLYLIPAALCSPRPLRLEYCLLPGSPPRPPLPLWPTSHTHSLLAWLGSPVTFPLCSSSQEAAPFPASGTAAASSAAAALLGQQGASCLRS
ncbi:hypothetical protein B0H13DRAFT_2339675 [Mycena leptocephala]|nr:hypothetical protein B0H13DRAFT_2339675 [Mycena leptocephala]